MAKFKQYESSTPKPRKRDGDRTPSTRERDAERRNARRAKDQAHHISQRSFAFLIGAAK